ncbi:MAG TPA: hypothetical protein VF784_10935, partial [Anaerolineales bacterium]
STELGTTFEQNHTHMVHFTAFPPVTDQEGCLAKREPGSELLARMQSPLYLWVRHAIMIYLH